MQKNKGSCRMSQSCSRCTAGISEEKVIFRKERGILVITASGITLAAGLYLEFVKAQQHLAQILFLVVVLISGYEIVKKALLSVRYRRLNMNVLITIAATGAFLIGHGEEGAAVVFLFYIAEFLEEYASERARNAVASLLKLAPEIAMVKRSGKVRQVRVQEVNIGDILVIRPGERIPLDGVVIRGASSVNQASITGESMPVSKMKGDLVFAGTINEEGYLEVRVTRRSDETLLSKIAKIVEEAQKEKSKTESFIDRFARYYTPLIVTLAFLVATIPTLVFGLLFEEWFYKALVLLVVSCPCALAISTPVSMVSGITSAARNGVLIKGASYLEEMKSARVVVFDKTGTLTEGRPEVTDIVTLNNYSEKDALQIAASLESRSKHPLAEAIMERARKEDVPLLNVKEFKSIAGKGLRGKIQGKKFYIGNRAFFREKGIPLPNELLESFEREGKTTVLVGNEECIISVIALMDRIRDASYEVIENLKKRGIRTVMLTGDNKKVAKVIANKLKIDEYYAELLPEDKARVIDTLLRKYDHVVMIGDGVNDAPALAKAHVGIAMGAIGSDIAIETSDIALMHDDLTKVSYLIDLSKKTMSVVKQNVVASILIKGSFAVLTFPGVISLWLAVAIGDMGLSLAVILNALRIGGKYTSG